MSVSVIGFQDFLSYFSINRTEAAGFENFGFEHEMGTFMITWSSDSWYFSNSAGIPLRCCAVGTG